MISDIDIYKQAYADGYRSGYEQASHRAESRQAIDMPLVATARHDVMLDDFRFTGMTIDEYAGTLQELFDCLPTAPKPAD